MSDFNMEAFCQTVLMPELAGIRARLDRLESHGNTMDRLATLIDLALGVKAREDANTRAIAGLETDVAYLKRRLGISEIPPPNGDVATVA